MQLILLSGGSGTRLWPLSNDARSKQFLKLLPAGPDPDRCESMIQRMVRQIRQSGIPAHLTVATSYAQRDSVTSQLDGPFDIVVEPSRRKTFPAIILACQYLHLVKRLPPDETVIVLPCDAFTDEVYFQRIKEMAAAVERRAADLLVMGIRPTYPSAKYGYILPGHPIPGSQAVAIRQFVEKPDPDRAARLIAQGARWNGGVFAFRLGYLLRISRRYIQADTYDEVLARYSTLPAISFDREVVEKADSLAMIPFDGPWKDLGTWNTLTDEITLTKFGNVITDDTVAGTHIFNNLDIPLLCLGTTDLVVAASPDGIIVTEKSKSENVKHYVSRLRRRPMYEERRWGKYKVISHSRFDDGFEALTKQLTLNPGCAISYQRHTHRDETWTFIDGEGILILEDERRPVRRGETVHILKGQRHALKAVSSLTFIEVQTGSPLIEEDIERFPLTW